MGWVGSSGLSNCFPNITNLRLNRGRGGGGGGGGGGVGGVVGV